MKHQPTKRRRSAALLALLSSLVLGISLLGVSGAVAHSRDHRPYWHIGHGWPTPPSDQALALQWFDLTNQTVAAAGFPEPITQSRTWAVSWVAADRAVQDGFGPRFQAAAFATALHDTLVAQVPSQQAQLDTALSSTLSGIP